jgi:hypothetical protein
MTRNLACMIPNGFLNRLNTVTSRESSMSAAGKPSCVHVEGFHIRVPFKLKNFCRKEYEENMILTVTRRESRPARSLSARSASCSRDSDGDEAQKQVAKRTSVCAWTSKSARYSVITNPLPTSNSVTRPVLWTLSRSTTGAIAAKPSSKTEFVGTLALINTGSTRTANQGSFQSPWRSVLKR